MQAFARSLSGAVVVAVTSITIAAEAQDPPTCAGLPATVVGTPGNDNLVGTDDPDYIVGLGGNDVIRGLDNSTDVDRLCGGRGADTVYGGSGYDWVEAGSGDDVVRDRDHIAGTLGPGDDSVRRAMFIRGGPGDDTMVGFRRTAPVDFTGGSGDDILVGTDACVHCWGEGDYLNGGWGDDVIRGRSKLNVVTPGPGEDTIHMGRRRNTWSGRLDYREAARPVKVDLRAGVARGQGVDRLFGVITQVYGSNLGDVLAGAGIRENLVGYRGDDVIRGRAGKDLLLGGAGTDRLFGGGGNDTCRGEVRERC